MKVLCLDNSQPQDLRDDLALVLSLAYVTQASGLLSLGLSLPEL